MGRWAAYAAATLVFLMGCSIGNQTETSGPMVFQEAALGEYDFESLAVLPFETPPLEHPAIGKGISNLFYDGIRATGKVKRVGLENDLEWYQEGYSESDKLESAIRMGRERGYDLVLFGDLEGSHHRDNAKTELNLTVRIVDTNTHETIFFGMETLTAELKGRSLPSFSDDEWVPIFEITFDHPRNLYEMIVKVVRDLVFLIVGPF